MELDNFTSFIEMGATLTIAFVAVEYTKQYTCLIAQKVFDYFGRIEKIVLECKKAIDEDTIDGLSSFSIDGCDAGFKIEGLKRKKEKALQDINDKKNSLNSYVLEKCNSKSYSALSLFTFLFSLVSLFIAGFDSNSIRVFWIVVVLLSFLYTVSSWIFGEKKRCKLWVDYSSLKCSIYVFSIILLLGIITTWIWGEILTRYLLVPYYDIAVYITLFLPYVNFVVFAFFIRSKSVDIYNAIEKTFEPLKAICKDIQKETDKLSTVKDLALEIKGAQKNSNVNEINDAKNLSGVEKRPFKKMVNRDLRRLL